MNSEFLFKALPIKSELWSFSITVKLCKTHEEFISNMNTLLGGYRFLKCDTHTHTYTHVPDSSAAHLSVSKYSNSRSGNSDCPCAQHTAEVRKRATR